MLMAYLCLKNVSFSYQLKDRKLVILLKQNLLFPCKGLVSIVGESGSGKSTLLNLLAGYLNTYQGEIKRDFSLLNTGFVFQKYHLIEHLNVIDNVILPTKFISNNKEYVVQKGLKCLKEVNIEQLAYRKISELSIGQISRVAIARSLMNNASVLFFDEPTGCLDSINSINIMEIIKNLSKTRLIILVSHNSSLVKFYSDVIYKIKNGKIEKIFDTNLALKTKLQIDKKKDIKSKISLKDNLKIALSFFKHKIFKTGCCLFFISLCLSFVCLLINLNFNGKSKLDDFLKQSLEYELISLSQKRVYELENQEMNLIKNIKVEENYQKLLKKEYQNIDFYTSLEYFIPQVHKVNVNNLTLKENVYFASSFPNKDKLSFGNLPSKYNEVIIDESFNSLIKSKDKKINFKNDLIIESEYLSNKIKDTLKINIEFKIVGVCKKSSFFKRPTIYFSYPLMKEYLFNLKLKNLTKLINSNYDITLKYRLELLSNDNDVLTSFKSLIKVDDPNRFNEFIKEKYDDIFSLNSYYLTSSTSMFDILSSLSVLVSLFLLLAIISSFFLQIVFVENLFQDRKVELAIYLSFHISKKTFMSLNIGQTLLMSFVTQITINVLYFILTFCLNKVLVNYNIQNLFSLFISFFMQICLFVLIFIFCYFTSYFPLNNMYKQDLVCSLKGD